MHVLLGIIFLFQSSATPANNQLRLTVLDAAGAIIPEASVLLVPNRCAVKPCAEPMRGARIEGKTSEGGAFSAELQPGVIYDLVVFKQGMKPLATTVKVDKGRREMRFVKMTFGPEWPTVYVDNAPGLIEVPPPKK
jgi:hypothetical protein